MANAQRLPLLERGAENLVELLSGLIERQSHSRQKFFLQLLGRLEFPEFAISNPIRPKYQCICHDALRRRAIFSKLREII